MADRSTYYDTTGKVAFRVSTMTTTLKRNYMNVVMGMIIPVRAYTFSPNADFTKELSYYRNLVGKQFHYKYINGSYPKPVTITDVDDLVYLDRVPCFRLYYTK